MNLKVVHKKLDPKTEIKQMWENYEKKFWDRQTNKKIQDFLTGTRDVERPERVIGNSSTGLS